MTATLQLETTPKEKGVEGLWLCGLEFRVQVMGSHLGFKVMLLQPRIVGMLRANVKFSAWGSGFRA